MYHFILDLVLFAVVFKAITIGSDFNLWYWVKYGKEYRTWYNNRPKFSKRIDPENPICPDCGNRIFEKYMCANCNQF